jgi:hypothetical protein
MVAIGFDAIARPPLWPEIVEDWDYQSLDDSFAGLKGRGRDRETSADHSLNRSWERVFPARRQAMGLLEFREEFDAFKMTLPDPRIVDWRPDGIGLPNPDLALDHTELMFYRWWAAMADARDQYRTLIQQAEGEALHYGLDVGVPYLLAQIDWVIDFFERLPPLPDWNKPDLTIAQRVELMNFAKRYMPSIQRWLSRTRSLRDSVQSIAQDLGN